MTGLELNAFRNRHEANSTCKMQCACTNQATKADFWRRICESWSTDIRCKGKPLLIHRIATALGTSEVYQELCPDPHAETLQVPVDSDWVDDRKTRQSCSGGAVFFHGCAVLARKGRELFRAQKPSCTVRSNRRFGSSTTLARMAVQNSIATSDGLTERTRGLQATRTGWNETYRAGDARSAGMAENGATSNPQSIDSRQSGRPHDQSHESRETDQVRTSVELARSMLHSNIRLM